MNFRSYLLSFRMRLRLSHDGAAVLKLMAVWLRLNAPAISLYVHRRRGRVVTWSPRVVSRGSAAAPPFNTIVSH